MSRTVRHLVRTSPGRGALGVLGALGLAAGTAAAQAPAQPPAAPAQQDQPQTQPAQTPGQPGQSAEQPGQAPGQQAPAQALTLADAERLALRQSPELLISQKSVEAASRRVKAARSQRLPRLSVESNLLLWHEPITFQLPPPMPGEAPLEVVVRGQVTSTTTVTVAQPLTPLIAIGKLVEIEEAGRSASEAELQGTRVDVAFRATDGYLVVLLAQAGREVAAQRVAQVEAQLGRARVLVEGGVLQPVDAMRLEVALAAAQRELITAESQERLAQGNLILALGMPGDATVDVQDTLPPEPQPPPAAVRDAMATAADQRADVRALTFRAKQAESGAGATKASLYPNVAAIGSFQHSEGAGSLQAAQSLFAGVTLQWNVWDWGQTWQSYKAAEIQAVQADLAATRMVDVVRVQVAAAASDAQSAYQALAVTRTGLAAAEEAYRIQSDRFSEGVATTTDVIDAEIEVTQARLGYASARYAYFRALASLARATGQMPSAFLSAI